ncbi:MAG TPA: hypothetical protein VMG41_09990 [Gemmatimonadales bacterium]|nr:hypothetical protein [Anaeromyxobacteraceae bacterium]HTS88809.1 hypothetical protein [Gemmatimonadales bacterium]
MPSAGDWEYDEVDEAEPFEAADPWENDESEDSEYEPEYDGEALPWQRPPPRRPSAPLRGVQTAVVRTPAGNANIQLPSKVATLGELSRVRRELASTQGHVRRLSADLMRARRASRTGARSDNRSARNTVLIVAAEAVRDVLRDLGTYSLIRSVEG